jgi:hypothetical protein
LGNPPSIVENVTLPVGSCAPLPPSGATDATHWKFSIVVPGENALQTTVVADDHESSVVLADAVLPPISPSARPPAVSSASRLHARGTRRDGDQGLVEQQRPAVTQTQG